ncbi:MAG: FAD-dependent oxidoreductase [Gammaproteobacteria bacterium]|nr:FAD-dependent oxidoreductase [Gammaproteobacteria bacterium]
MRYEQTGMFRGGQGTRRRIAVIGAGISGLGAAWLLSRSNDVVVFEAAHRPGGHARTLVIKTKGRELSVDTGFIVFNKVNYPHLCQLFKHLDVPIHKSDMSFAVSVNGGAIEYGCRDMNAVLAQPMNAARPNFWRMFRDIAVFNKTALADSDKDPSLTLSGLIRQRGLGSWFTRYYLLPMSGAIWSTPRAEMLNFPARVLTRFFDNHGLLAFSGRPQWWTVTGGSHNYVSKMIADMNVRLWLHTPVEAVIRQSDGVHVKAAGQESEVFDSVVFACHADTALALLADSSAKEQRILGQIPFRRNRIVLHTDARLMPRRKACWSSWVYLAKSRSDEDQASVTYWMNSLQGIPQETPLFATLNPSTTIDDALILDEHAFEHPQYDFNTIAAQAALPSIQGRANTWYCGAWTGTGFHEDGLSSAVSVAQRLGASPPWA